MPELVNANGRSRTALPICRDAANTSNISNLHLVEYVTVPEADACEGHYVLWHVIPLFLPCVQGSHFCFPLASLRYVSYLASTYAVCSIDIRVEPHY